MLKLQKKRFNLSPARSTTGYYKTAKKKDLYPTSFLKLVLPSSPAFCNAKYRGELRSVATRRGIKNTCNGSNRVNPLSPCVPTREYRGSAQRARGLEYKQDPPIPPLSGGEVARKTEEKWARTVRTKRVPQTPTATVATNPKAR